MENQTGSNQNSAVVILSILLFLAFGVIIFLLIDRSSNTDQPVADTRSGISAPTFSPISQTPIPVDTKINLDKKYLFAINNQTGTKVGEFEFLIKNVERTTEIDVPGGKAVALTGRELLIINVELTNSGNIPASVVSRNYLRLTINGQDKLIAPEYHADPVDLQPQSTKNIRIGFNIAKTDQILVMQVGELTGEKDIINLF